MTHANDTQNAMNDLAQLLEAYGADQARWPAARRSSVEGVLASDPRARAMLAEAAAFDRLLDGAASVPPEREHALAQRIVAMAQANAPPLDRRPVVVAFKRPAGRLTVDIHRAAVASLAASLLLGMFVGSSGAGRSALGYVSEAIGLGDDWSEVATGDPVPGSDEVL